MARSGREVVTGTRPEQQIQQPFPRALPGIGAAASLLRINRGWMRRNSLTRLSWAVAAGVHIGGSSQGVPLAGSRHAHTSVHRSGATGRAWPIVLFVSTYCPEARVNILQEAQLAWF